MKKQITQTLVLASVLTLAGCQQYLVRSDLVNPYVGDAVARNASNQTIDPWPRYVYDTNIQTSSQRQNAALKKYHAGPKGDDQAAAAPAVAIQNVDPTN